jgi:hypothetical protein
MRLFKKREIEVGDPPYSYTLEQCAVTFLGLTYILTTATFAGRSWKSWIVAAPVIVATYAAGFIIGRGGVC